MNLLECYIKNIIFEKTYPTPEWDEENQQWVEVQFEYNCYGSLCFMHNIYPIQEWEAMKKKGYFMG